MKIFHHICRLNEGKSTILVFERGYNTNMHSVIGSKFKVCAVLKLVIKLNILFSSWKIHSISLFLLHRAPIQYIYSSK